MSEKRAFRGSEAKGPGSPRSGKFGTLQRYLSHLAFFTSVDALSNLGVLLPAVDRAVGALEETGHLGNGFPDGQQSADEHLKRCAVR